MMIKTLLTICTAITLIGCTTPMLTDNTLESMSTSQIKQLHASAEKYPWWFDNKKASELYTAELKRREALNKLAEEDVQAASK